jgi:polyhydroxyalkanoate synthase subunit PhaC
MLGGSNNNNNNISKIYSSYIELLQNLFYNSLHFFNNYHLLYLNSLNQYMTDNGNKINQNKAFQLEDSTSFFSSFSYFPYYYMNKWLEATDEEANRLLKSQQFLYNFREYIKSIIKYEKLVKEESNNNNNPFVSINDLDKITDRYQDYLNKEFIPFIFNQQSPHNVSLQIDTFRLLKYNNQIDNKLQKSELNVNSQKQQQQQQKQEQKMSQDTIQSPQITPILIVYAPINRYHVLDINQKRSIVKQFLSKGFDVFLIDWGLQNTEQIDNKSSKLIEDYLNFIDKSVHKIKELTKSNTVNLYGYSWGGLLCTLYTSFQNFNKNIQNLILHSSPLDFSKDNTIIAEWLRKFPKDEYVNQYKEMHGGLIDASFLMRNPFKHNLDSLRYALTMQIDTNTNNNSSNRTIENYQNIDWIQLLADVIRLRTWITNTPDLPGELFKQFIDYFYCKNAIITNHNNKHETQLSSNSTNENRNTNTKTGLDENLNNDNNNKSSFPSIEKIIYEMDLTGITIPTLSIVGKNDDLISYDSSISINNYISTSDKDLIEFPGDHIELCISYSAHNNIWPRVVEWLVQRS